MHKFQFLITVGLIKIKGTLVNLIITTYYISTIIFSLPTLIHLHFPPTLLHNFNF